MTLITREKTPLFALKLYYAGYTMDTQRGLEVTATYELLKSTNTWFQTRLKLPILKIFYQQNYLKGLKCI